MGPETIDPTGEQNASTLGNDMLRTVHKIAKFLGESDRRTHYMLEQKQIPGFKIGAIWHARPSTLIAFVKRLEAGDERP